MTESERNDLNKMGLFVISVGGISLQLISQQDSQNRFDAFRYIRKEMGKNGFTEFYLYTIRKAKKQPDIVICKKLLDIDSRLGANTSELLTGIVYNTTNIDFIKVRKL